MGLRSVIQFSASPYYVFAFSVLIPSLHNFRALVSNTPCACISAFRFLYLHTSRQTDEQTHKWLNYKVGIEIIFATIVVTKYTFVPAARNCGNQNLFALPLRSVTSIFLYMEPPLVRAPTAFFLCFSRFVRKLQFKKLLGIYTKYSVHFIRFLPHSNQPSA